MLIVTCDSRRRENLIAILEFLAHLKKSSGRAVVVTLALMSASWSVAGPDWMF